MKRWLLCVFCCAVLFTGLAAPVQSGSPPFLIFYELGVLPAPAREGDLLQARMRYQTCIREEYPGSFSLSRTDNVLTLTLQMIPVPPGTICFTPPPAEFIHFQWAFWKPVNIS